MSEDDLDLLQLQNLKARIELYKVQMVHLMICLDEAAPHRIRVNSS